LKKAENIKSKKYGKSFSLIDEETSDSKTKNIDVSDEIY
jgi:hypothetical protein